MGATDVSDPRYYHKVVDCSGPVPAHTDVPGYLRLIAQGKYDESYLLNRESNVFPGILGRTCDRPCEPACRRGRIDEKPVAICRLKRVASDLAGTSPIDCPRPRGEERQAHRLHRGRAGLADGRQRSAPARLRRHDLREERAAPGLMRVNIPAFRLPARCSTRSAATSSTWAPTMKYGTKVDSLQALLDEGYDAVFVGSGAPKGKELDLPGRWDAPSQVHIGIDWLANVHFKPHREDRAARADHRRGQHGHGLLPDGQTGWARPT
jgi:formate dehydrogenase (NADP+) beta subunit